VCVTRDSERVWRVSESLLLSSKRLWQSREAQSPSCLCLHSSNRVFLSLCLDSPRDVGGRGRYPPVLHFFSFEPILWFDLYQINYRYHALMNEIFCFCLFLTVVQKSFCFLGSLPKTPTSPRQTESFWASVLTLQTNFKRRCFWVYHETLVGSLKPLVSFAQYRHFYRSLLQKRPMNFFQETLSLWVYHETLVGSLKL